MFGGSLFLCLSGCISCFCSWTCKVFTRLYLVYLISCLEAVKRVEVLKAKKQYIRRDRSIFELLNPINLVSELMANVTTFFVSDDYPGYLKLMLVKGTREENLLKMTAFFITGLLTSITFYFIQTYALQRMDSETLAFALLVLAICTLGPLVTMYGKVLSLLLIPISLVVILRALLVTTILEDVQRVALSNINDNWDRTLQTISCDRKAVVGFASKIDFNFRVGDKRSKGDRQTSFDVNLGEKGDPLHSILVGIEEFKRTTEQIYRLTMYAINGVVGVAKSMSTWIGDALASLSSTDLAEWMKENIGTFAANVLELLQGAIVEIGKAIYKAVESATSGLINIMKTLGNKLKKTMLSELTIKYSSNYVFTTDDRGSRRNASLRKLLIVAKDRLFEKHTWLLVLKRLLTTILYSWLFLTLFRIFSGPIAYLMLYLYIGNYDNLYLTESFYAYEREQQVKGCEPVMPLYLFETAIFVPRTASQLNIAESGAIMWALLLDAYVAIYTAFLFALDWIAYQMVMGVRRLTERVADDLVEPSLTLTPDSVPLLSKLFTVGGDGVKLLTDISAMRSELLDCIPRESPLDWELYKQAAILQGALLLITFTWPYIRRTRSAICDAYFPERKRTRAAWLYGHIILQRIIFRTIVNLVMPQAKAILFQKAGQVNPLIAQQGNVDLEEEKAIRQRQRQSPCCPLFLYWPFSALGRALGCLADDSRKSRCLKCPKFVDPFGYAGETGIRCPNTAACDAIYCVPCYQSLRRICVSCGAEIRDEGVEELSEEEEVDSSADEWDGL